MPDRPPMPQTTDDAQNESATVPSSRHYDTRERELTRWRRMQIPLFANAVYSFVRAVGPTLRFEILGWQHAERAYAAGQRIIWPFWHRCIVPVLWWGRGRGVVVMNSTNFDGQWTRRVIERLGFGTAQGSSTRGGLRGLAVMAQRLDEGKDVGFTIDGPRGPRYIAKPGPAMLARRTGCPIIPFHVGVERGTTIEKSWDLFRVPHLFSRVIFFFAPPIYVPQDAGRELLETKHAEMQHALEEVRDLAESWFELTAEEQERLRAQWNA